MTLEEQAASLSQEEIVSQLVAKDKLEHQNQELVSKQEKLKHELAWFKRQLFGAKSERRLLDPESRQLSLGEALLEAPKPPAAKQSVKSYERKKRRKAPLEGSPEDTGLRFDPEQVPVEEIEVANPECEGRSADEYEVVSEKTTYRLAQRPGSYVVLKYIRKTVKFKETRELSTPAAPPAVIEKSYADVSFLVGLIIEKFLFHLPLYRQHQRLERSGLVLSRATLTQLVYRSAELLEPIYLALLSSIVQSKVLAMDETPIKAGRKSKGKMQKGYFWPIYGDQDEIAFVFATSRAQKVACEALSEFCGVLVSDGYKVYERVAESLDSVTHAQCWSHTRRKFVEAQDAEPELVRRALEFIGELYQNEKNIREQNIEAEKKLLYRAEHSIPIISSDKFDPWRLEEKIICFAGLRSAPGMLAFSTA